MNVTRLKFILRYCVVSTSLCTVMLTVLLDQNVDLHDHNNNINVIDTYPLEQTDLLLSVPFYVYENEFLKNDEVLNITETYEYFLLERFTNNQSSTISKNITFFDFAEKFKYYKHFGDVHFIRSALQHPMRVMNPEDAKIFVVPSLLTYHLLMNIYRGTPTIKKEIHTKLQTMNKKLGASQWFRRNDGADHIAPVAMFYGESLINRWFSNLSKCNMVQFYENSGDPSYINPTYQKNRTMFKIFKVGKPCSVIPFEQKLQDFAFIGRLTKKGKLDRFYVDRRNTCKWILQANHSYSLCGRGDQCPHLSNAMLGFHLRGDGWSSNRLFDTLLSGTVPLFTNDLQYASQPQWYDWDMISYKVNVQNKTSFIHSTKEILKNKTDIMVKTKNVLDNKNMFDWQTIFPFDI